VIIRNHLGSSVAHLVWRTLMICILHPVSLRPGGFAIIVSLKLICDNLT